MGVGPLTLPLSAAEVVPHLGAMVLLRDVVAHGPRHTVCDAVAREGAPLVCQGRWPVWVSIELMAQTVAAHSGMIGRRKGGDPEIGFLIGVRRCAFDADGFAVGTILRVEVTWVWGDDRLFSFEGVVRRRKEEKPLATAQLNLFKPAPQDIGARS
ncbi:MAG: hypothetical protein IPP35_08040 [Elusimicrobia bacterium]|nr:hypothetical protein [Elusimicrobiota bacterium]